MASLGSARGSAKRILVPSFTELEVGTDFDKLDELVIDYLQPFEKELYSVSSDATISQILRSSGQSLNDSIKSLRSNPNYHDSNGQSTLHAAVQSQRVDLVKSLTEFGVHLENKTSTGLTALHFASIGQSTEVVQWLVSSGANVNAVDRDGSTPLHLAAYNGNLATVQTLLQRVDDANVVDHRGRTPLMTSCQQGHLAVVKKLLKLKDNTLQTTTSGKTALFYAALKGHQDVVEVLVQTNKSILDVQDADGHTVLLGCAVKGDVAMVKVLHRLGANINAECKIGRTAVMAASQTGHVETVLYLIGAGCQITQNDNYGDSAIVLAVSECHHKIVEELLCKAPNLVDQKNRYGDTPLIMAASSGDRRMLEILLKYGAKIDFQNNDGKTALMSATSAGHEYIVQYLLSKGSSVNKKMSSGITAFQIAQAKNLILIEKHLKSVVNNSSVHPGEDSACFIFLAIEYDNIQLIKKHFAKHSNADCHNAQGVTPLMYGCIKGNLNVVKLLLQRGAKPDKPNQDGMNALGYALVARNVRIVDYLVAYGAQLDGRDNTGQTLLHHATRAGDMESVKFLERLGVDLECYTTDGHTSLMIAAKHGFHDIVKFLMDCGANTEAVSTDGYTACDIAFISNHVNIATTLRAVKIVDKHQQSEHLQEELNIAIGNCDIQRIEHLIRSHHVSVNYQYVRQDGRTPLHCASQLNIPQLVNILCENGAQINKRCFKGGTPLILASYIGNLETVKSLVGLGANVNIVDYDGGTALIDSVQNKHFDVVEFLIRQGCLLNIRTSKYKTTALNYAIQRDHIDMVKILLENDVAFDTVDFQGRTALGDASLRGHITIVEMLIQHGAQVNHCDRRGSTALMGAAQNGHLNIVKYLAKSGADIWARDIGNQTAMSIASVRGHFEVVGYLESGLGLESGGDRDDEPANKCQSKIIESSIERRYLSVAEELQNKQLVEAAANGTVENVKELLLRGVEVNCKDSAGCTPLMHAVRRKNSEMIQLLLQHNADINLCDKDNHDAFTCTQDSEAVNLLCNLLAIEPRGVNDDLISGSMSQITDDNPFCDHPKLSRKESQNLKPFPPVDDHSTDFLESVKVGDEHGIWNFLENPGIVKCKDIEGRNAIHYCASSRSPACVSIFEVLKSYGADIDCSDRRGETPLLLSLKCGNTSIANQLVKRGVDLKCSDSDWSNPLLECCLQGNVEVLDTLLQHTERMSPSDVATALQFVILNGLDSLTKVFLRKFDNTEFAWKGLAKTVNFCNLLEDKSNILKIFLHGHQKSGVLCFLRIILDCLMESEGSGQNLYEIVAGLSNEVPDTVIGEYVVIKQWDHQEMSSKRKREVQQVYSSLTSAILQCSPSGIDGFTVDKRTKKIVVFIKEGCHEEVENFVLSKVLDNGNKLELIEFSTQKKEAIFLSQKLGPE